MINTEQLLKLMEDNANLTHAQIAVMLGADEKEVSKAIEKLEKNGTIKAYKTQINWERISHPMATALIEVRVTPQKDTGFDEIAKTIMALPEVDSVYLMSGGYDLAVIVTAPTMSQVAMFVSRRLAPIGGILSTATHFILTKYKDQGTVMMSDFEQIDERGSQFYD